jgi:DNA-binding NarL/FixJ family response regulator
MGSTEEAQPSSAKEVTVWIVEDDRPYREALFASLDGVAGIRCERSFSSCEEALAAFSSDGAPHVVLMDINLGSGMNGIEGGKRIKVFSPSTSIIMLTNFDDDDDVFKAICAGADGYLVKNVSLDRTIGSIEEVIHGGPPMNASIARKVMHLFQRFNAPKDLGLTSREHEILQCLSEGLTKKNAAEKLCISQGTVDSHTKNIYKKLKVHTMSEAVRIWMSSHPSKTSQ